MASMPSLVVTNCVCLGWDRRARRGDKEGTDEAALTGNGEIWGYNDGDVEHENIR